MTDHGKVSVLMGIYNCETTLSESIDSILAQTYPNWELILCDDCSTDGTYALAKTYAEQYPEKIILLRNETNSRLAFSLNRCLEKTTGKFVARMDGDDKCVPERFEKQIDYLLAHPDAVLVGTAMQRFYNDGSFGAVDACRPEPDKFTPHHNGPTFNHATILAYKSVFDALGGYTVSPRTVRGQDRDLWFRFFAAGYKGVNMPDPLYLVREDVEAIRRRTFRDRWISFETEIYGYRLLHYPLHWYVMPVLRLGKALVPYKAQLLYRKIQAKKRS